MPPPPQDSPAGQGKSTAQSMTPPATSSPQPFDTRPHLPAHALLAASGSQTGVAPQCCATAMPQSSPTAQPPQSMVPPQPFPISPQSAPAAAQLSMRAGQSVAESTGSAWHWNGADTPQASPEAQVPQR